MCASLLAAMQCCQCRRQQALHIRSFASLSVPLLAVPAQATIEHRLFRLQRHLTTTKAWLSLAQGETVVFPCQLTPEERCVAGRVGQKQAPNYRKLLLPGIRQAMAGRVDMGIIFSGSHHKVDDTRSVKPWPVQGHAHDTTCQYVKHNLEYDSHVSIYRLPNTCTPIRRTGY